MKTKILILLSIITALIFIGTIKVQAYSYAHTAEELANVLGDATYSGNVVKLENDVILMQEIMINSWEPLILDLNGFSIRGVSFEVHSDLYVKNGTIEGHMSYWNTLTVENAIVNSLNGQAESFTNVKGSSTLNGTTLGNLTIEKDGTLVVDSKDFEFGYHDYNENGHLCTNNGTIMIKDVDSEFIIGSGNNILNNGNIINNGTYTNNGNNLYEVIIPNLDNGKITSNSTIVSKDEKIQLSVEIDEGYILQSITAYKLTDKNTIVNMENNSFIMPDYSVIIEPIIIAEQYVLLEGDNSKFTINSNEELTFKTDGRYKLFSGVKVDDKLISEDNYIVKEGSTIITLKNNYLNSLEVGKHKLEILYSNGAVINCNFEILQEIIEKDETPKTGNTDYIYLATIICVIAIAGAILLIKKK